MDLLQLQRKPGVCTILWQGRSTAPLMKRVTRSLAELQLHDAVMHLCSARIDEYCNPNKPMYGSTVSLQDLLAISTSLTTQWRMHACAKQP